MIIIQFAIDVIEKSVLVENVNATARNANVVTIITNASEPRKNIVTNRMVHVLKK
ncbi:hypothetical protein [Paenibacillus sp. UMB4589-SE434]|uniref:hypothetical protein n=1 Tax=Paenibacillus sp. UMB4589-SE434 TaxID=3046314 RepID=UPI00254A286B|nr:hypothetical protein [Paenibacillus sp. UMB4589-SE434]MDK8181204.1 hypothetical protein [Paenibacillus sp. UMB4589-SE434]